MNAEDLNLGDSLKAARESAGKSMRAVERETGTARRYLAEYESGTKTPNVAVLLRLLACYGLHDVAAVIMGLDANVAVKLHDPVSA